MHERSIPTGSQIDPSEFAKLARPELQPHGYKKINLSLAEAYNSIRKVDERRANQYVKHAITELLANFRLAESRVELPLRVGDLYERELSRIRHQLNQFGLEYYDFDNDPFIKDFAILTHRFIPIGAEFAVPFSGIPRRVLVQGGIFQFMQAVRVVAFKTRGFKPFFSLHAHPLSLGEFHRHGWEESYHRLAELLELNPGFKGVISASWFLDPALKSISPQLSYLREVPEHNGAVFLFVEYDREGTSGALAKSPTRRKLFSEGRYIPAIYMRIWPRIDILRWSKANRKNEPKTAV